MALLHWALGIAQASGATAEANVHLSACQPSWVPSFDAVPGYTPFGYDLVLIKAAQVYDDGLGNGPALYLGGNFQYAGDQDSSNLTRWDGRRWGRMEGFDDGVEALAVFDDGTGPALYAGGTFTTAGGQPASRIARWDGANWTPLGAGVGGGFEPTVRALTVFDDGSGPALYVAGDFTQAGGAAASNIAKWNGTSWSTLAGGVNASVFALTVFDDGSGPALFAGGVFSAPGNRVARWNGTSWSALGSGIGGNTVVFALRGFDDGSGPALYVGGRFNSAGGTAVSNIARWNGSTWSAVGAGLTNTILPQSSFVFALEVHDDGGGAQLYAGGSFNFSGSLLYGSPAFGLCARWDGSAWSGFGGGLGYANGRALRAFAPFDDGTGGGERLYAVGNFSAAGGFFTDAYGIALWNGSDWRVPGRGLNAQVNALATFDDGRGTALYVGGTVTQIDGKPVNRIARWDGTSWEPLLGGVSGLGGATVLDMLPWDDGSGPALYVAGSFDQAGGISTSGVARWDGTSWSALNLQGTGVTLAAFDDGTGPGLYVGGSFVAGNAYGVARWTGSAWLPLGFAMDQNVHALAAFDDGTGPALYAGGDFTEVGGLPVAHVARWDGASWSEVGGGTDGTVAAMTVFDDGSGPGLFAAGAFSMAGGVSARNVAKWDGQQWAPLASGLVGGGILLTVFALTVFDDGTGSALYAGGDFTDGGGLLCRSLARWDGTSWAPLGRGVINDRRQNQALDLCGFDAGFGPDLYVGGAFTLALDSGDAFLARWDGCKDTVPPVLICPDALGVDDPLGTPLGEAVFFSVTASDDQDPSPTIVCAPPSGSIFPPGVTRVQCTATDASGNTGTCHFDVFVNRRIRRR